MLRSLTICGVLLGLTACAVGSESTALQAPADPPAGELHPDATEAGLLVLGMLSRGAEALATGNAAEALTFLDQAIEAGGEDSTALFLRGVAHLEVGDAESAQHDLERALELKPDDVAAWCALARARRAGDDLDGAVDAVTRAVELSPEDVRLLTLQGHMLIEAGRMDDAHEALEHAARLDPANVETQRTLGILYTEAGDPAAAEQAWRAALALAPDDVMLHAGLASCLRDLGRDEEALASYREAIRLDPDNPVHQANLASTSYRLNRLVEARDAYQAALALESLPPHAHSFVALNYGVVLERLGDEQGAIDAYQESIDNDPERAEAHEALGLLLLDRGEEQGAYEHLGAAFDLDLVSPEAVLHLGLLADRIGVPERARQCAALLDAWEESDVAVAYRRAQLLVRCHDPEVHDGPTAIGILQELVDGPLARSAAAWNMLAEALVGEGRFDDALKATDRALELVEPGDPAWNRSRDLREHCLLSLVGN